MVKLSTLKTLGLIFGILCAVGLVLCLMCAVQLPTRMTFRTIYGTVTRVSGGSLDLNYLSSIVLLAMGAFAGFSVFGSIKVEKQEKKAPSEEEKAKVEIPLSDVTSPKEEDAAVDAVVEEAKESENR